MLRSTEFAGAAQGRARRKLAIRCHRQCGCRRRRQHLVRGHLHQLEPGAGAVRDLFPVPGRGPTPQRLARGGE